MDDISPGIAIGGFASSIGAGLYLAKRIVAGYKAARWEAEQRRLGLDKDLPPPPPPRLPPPAPAAVLPVQAAAAPPSRPSPPPPRADAELSRIALGMIEELQLTMQRQRTTLAKLEADGAIKDAMITALQTESAKRQDDLQRQRASLDRLETENLKQTAVIQGLRGENETLRRDIGAGQHERPDTRKSLTGSGEYRDYAGVRTTRNGGPVLRPQADPVPRGSRGRKGD